MAPAIPEETINRIKNVANIVDIVGDSVALKKAGRNFLGLCPFHTEKTPSFTVSAEKQIFYCFGCHTGGNVFSFVMQQEGVSFPEAVRLLGNKYGIEIPNDRMSSQQKRRLSEKEKLFRINELAMVYYRQTLQNPTTGQQAKAYLIGRGMTHKVIDEHQIGYTPNRWDGLIQHLAKQKVPLDLIHKTGLIIPRKDSSGFYDRFRDRIMFPIFDQNYQIIGFGGRVTGNGKPKYLNSPETPLYNKRRSLYGIQKAKQQIRKTSIVYLVEGYFDVIALHLYGIHNAVATLGTALTSEHVKILKSLVGPTGKAVLVYDSDQAGIKAALRSIEIFEQGLLDARILVLPDGYDPDDFLKEYGPEDFKKACDQAMAMVPFLMESAIQRYGLSLEGRVKVVSEMQAPLGNVQDNIARSLYIKKIAERLDIDEAAVMERVKQSMQKRSRNHSSVLMTSSGQEIQGGDRLEQKIVAMMMRFPVMIPDIVGNNLLDYFEDNNLKTIGQMIINQNGSEETCVADLVSMIEDSKYRNLLTKLAIEEQHWERHGCERLLVQFESRHRRKIVHNLQRQIEAAEKENDVNLLSKLLAQKQFYARKK